MVSRVCLVSVRAINRSTSGFPNALVNAAAAENHYVGENQTSLPLLASYKGGLLYVLTVYPAESWEPARTHPQVCAIQMRILID